MEQWLFEKQAPFLNAHYTPNYYVSTMNPEFIVEKTGSEKLNNMPKRTVSGRVEI